MFLFFKLMSLNVILIIFILVIALNKQIKCWKTVMQRIIIMSMFFLSETFFGRNEFLN